MPPLGLNIAWFILKLPRQQIVAGATQVRNFTRDLSRNPDQLIAVIQSLSTRRAVLRIERLISMKATTVFRYTPNYTEALVNSRPTPNFRIQTVIIIVRADIPTCS